MPVVGLARSIPGQKSARTLTFAAAIDPALPICSVSFLEWHIPCGRMKKRKRLLCLHDSEAQNDADANLLHRSKIKPPDGKPRKYGEDKVCEGGPDWRISVGVNVISR